MNKKREFFPFKQIGNNGNALENLKNTQEMTLMTLYKENQNIN